MFLSLKELFLFVKNNNHPLTNRYHIEPVIFQQNLDKMRHMILSESYPNFTFLVDSNLLKLNIKNLVQRVNLAQLQNFIVLSQIEFLPNKKSKTITFFNPENLEGGPAERPIRVNITFEERENILCGKQKRKDERIKFVFKTLRKTLIKAFKEKTKHTDKIEDLKNRFNSKYFSGDKESIRTYYSNDLSRRTLCHLLRHPNLMKKLRWAYRKEYLGQQIDSICFRKMDDRFANKLSLEMFCKSLFDRQSKHSWNLLDIIYSLITFQNFFDSER